MEPVACAHRSYATAHDCPLSEDYMEDSGGFRVPKRTRPKLAEEEGERTAKRRRTDALLADEQTALEELQGLIDAHGPPAGGDGGPRRRAPLFRVVVRIFHGGSPPGGMPLSVYGHRHGGVIVASSYRHSAGCCVIRTVSVRTVSVRRRWGCYGSLTTR